MTRGWAQAKLDKPQGVMEIKSGIQISMAAIAGISRRFLYALIYA